VEEVSIVVNSPFLGPPREIDTWTCGFMKNPGDIFHCDAPAKYHGLIFEEDLNSFKAGMFCCEEHLSTMKLSSDLEHDLGSACGLPNSICEWDHGISWCHVPWDIDKLLEGQRPRFFRIMSEGNNG
jgi:hypothetical protein